MDEAKSLSEQISYLNKLLSSKKLIFQLIEKEAIELKHKFGSPRLSLIEDSGSSQLDEIDNIPNEEMLLTLSEKGYAKRMQPNSFNLKHKRTIGKSVGKMRVNDLMSNFIVCCMHDHILYFSDKGMVYSARAYQIPECSRTASGTPLVQLLRLSEGEKRIMSIIPISDFVEDLYLVMLTVNGYIKKVSLNSFSAIRAPGIIGIQLVPGDELKWVRLCADSDLVTLASQKGMVIVNYCSKLQVLGRKVRGVTSMKLKGDDKMASMDVIPAAIQKDLQKLSESISSRGKDLGPPWLLLVSESGHGKCVPLRALKLSNFNRVGLLGYKLPPACRLSAVHMVGFSLSDGESDEQVVLVSQSGTVNRIKVQDVPVQSRAGSGVILRQLECGGKIRFTSLISASTNAYFRR